MSQLHANLRNLLADITREVLRTGPINIVLCVRKYLKRIWAIRESKKEAYKTVENICNIACIVADVTRRTKMDKIDVLSMLLPIFNDIDKPNLTIDYPSSSQLAYVEGFLNQDNNLYRSQDSGIQTVIKDMLILYLFCRDEDWGPSLENKRLNKAATKIQV